MEPSGVGLALRGRNHVLKATPSAGSVPQIWLLGSSDYSARLAAEKGMPYVFAHHFSGSGTAEALDLYRSTFRPSPELEAPRTFLTVNAAVAESAEEAHRLALPQLLQMVALRTGQPLTAQRTVEDAEQVVADGLPESHASLIDAMRQPVGDRGRGRRPGRDRAARGVVRRRRGDGQPGRRRGGRHGARQRPRTGPHAGAPGLCPSNWEIVNLCP